MAEQTTAASSSRRCPCGLCFDPPPFPTRPDWSVRHALCSLILSLRDAKAIALGDVLIAIAVHKVNLCALNMAQRRDITLMLRNTKIILVTTAAIFRCRTVVPDYSNDQVIEYGQKVLLKTQDDADFRRVLGNDFKVWQELHDAFAEGSRVLEEQSFLSQELTNAECAYASPSVWMTQNHTILTRDLERLNGLLTIARNMLATTTRAQNLAAEAGFDQQVLKLVDICVRVTARGYDGEVGSRHETQWGAIVGSYKKLLITCLQFLHNFVMHNEHRKLLLWLDLFSSSGTADPKPISPASDRNLTAETIEHMRTMESAIAQNRGKGLAAVENLDLAFRALGGSNYPLDKIPPNEATRLASEVMETVSGLVNMTLDHEKSTATPASRSQQDRQQVEPETQPPGAAIPEDDQKLKQDWSWANLPDSMLYSDPRSNIVQEDDRKIGRTPESAALTLQEAKDQLMARLQETQPLFPKAEGQARLPKEGNGEEQLDEEGEDFRGSDVAADGSVEDDEDDEEYHGPGDQERGLLTDIPLVLGPQEIEALPMIIQAGIVNSTGPSTNPEVEEVQKMQAVRCNILLAQEAGRNLLRELLIFIAAWDLQDGEFYFKLMIQIMEAILQNGLMPFAYQSFCEAKDIVSPAQSTVIKILTQIFRKKQGLVPSPVGPPQVSNTPRQEELCRVDILIVRYIFTVFRQSIIPETCALIYLQGQIRAGAALPEDFPLNLWDMERVYEGVYQFLEFFAVLTETDDWKQLLVSWEIVSELVTLLRELEAGIPKAPLGPATQNASKKDGKAQDSQVDQNRPAPVAVERPYDPVATDASNPVESQPGAIASDSPSQAIDNQDPCEFEWRNLKKLVVLVLSSLVWKSPTVQTQIRCYGGVQLILSCCNFDNNNPYIKEHAIMCLRFLLEGNEENKAIVKELEAKSVVPNEVLDKRGYETFLDEAGKVGLRRKEGVSFAA